MLSARPVSLEMDVDAHQHAILNTKTPGRKGAKGRSALQENALYNGPKTVQTKKSTLQTPFRPGTAHGKKPLVSVSVTRPLMDKTPFPNRVAASLAGNAGKTPGLKLSKLALLAPEPDHESLSSDVAPLLRPSSNRKTLRGRLSQTFKTPMTKGNYWDVSPGDMEGIGGGLVEQAAPETAVVPTEEDDEIEYMPPTAIERPYEPLFEMPDYKVMGASLFQLGHSGLVDSTADEYYAADIEQQIDINALLNESGSNPAGPSKLDSLELPALDDDSPFGRKPAARKPTLAPAPTKSAVPLARAPSARAAPARTPAPSRPATAIPSSRATSRMASSASLPAGAPAAPAQTRTSALRAAKAAAASSSSSATTPTVPVARPATKTHARTASTSGIARPAASSIPTPTAGGAVRPRSATVTGRPRAAAPAPKGKAAAPEDELAVLFEKQLGGFGGEDDFRFTV